MSYHAVAEVEKAFKILEEQLKGAKELTFPPTSFITQGVNFIEYQEGKVLCAEFSFDERFLNPLNTYQGGFLCAAIDNVMGPLTYLAALKPVLTVQLNTTFIRPFIAQDKKITIKAEVVLQSKSLMVLQAEVKTAEGKLIALANSQSFIMN